MYTPNKTLKMYELVEQDVYHCGNKEKIESNLKKEQNQITNP